jgi:sugar O-acyltransferase (sialic acid O-acetyltransferase NeuD family)
MRRLVIIGAGGLGREMLAWSRQATEAFEVRGFLDDNLEALKGFSKDVPVIGRITDYEPEPGDVFTCAIGGKVEQKRRCIQQILSRGGEFANVIHASAVVGDPRSLGVGTILCPHSVVAADVKLGAFVTVNTHSTLGHDAVVGDWTQLHCHVDITGAAVLGEGVLAGSHSSVLPKVRVGDGAVIGAGSIVVWDVPPGTTVFGAPARPISKRPVTDA